MKLDKHDAFQSIIDRFPFEEISERMNRKPRWYWREGTRQFVPTARQLVETAVSMFNFIVTDSRNIQNAEMGGFSLNIKEHIISLSFEDKKDVWASVESEYSDVIQ